VSDLSIFVEFESDVSFHIATPQEQVAGLSFVPNLEAHGLYPTFERFHPALTQDFTNIRVEQAAYY
jgi:hypothetical protein